MNATDITVPVTVNDLLPTDCTKPTVEILAQPAYRGTATLSGSNILYTPLGSIYNDTLRYRIYCGDPANANTAYIFFI